MDTKKLIQAIKMLVESEVKRKFAEEKKFLKKSNIKEQKKQTKKQKKKKTKQQKKNKFH